MSADEHLSQITTVWTLLRQAHEGDGERARQARDQILARYRGAVYRYLRKAVGEAEAEDLTQEFALALLQGKFHRAEPGIGRFRDYVRTCLFNLVRKHRRAGRGRPAGQAGDPVDASDPAAAADQEFIDAWRDQLSANALEKIRQTQPHWHDILHLKAEDPKLPSHRLAEILGARWGKPQTAEGVRQLLRRARDRFADLLIDEVIHEVTHSLDHPTRAEVGGELAALGLLEYCRAALARREDLPEG
jgi:RNA polymerase sigma factor (sigma-70 family)